MSSADARTWWDPWWDSVLRSPGLSGREFQIGRQQQQNSWKHRQPKLLSPVHNGNYSRRKPRPTVAETVTEFGDCSRQCGQGFKTIARSDQLPLTGRPQNAWLTASVTSAPPLHTAELFHEDIDTSAQRRPASGARHALAVV